MEVKCEKCKMKENGRSEEMKSSMDTRINRIIGQLNGIKQMIKDDRYCKDVLIQIAAVESALQNVGYIILKDHMNTCVTDKIKEGDLGIIDETLDLMKKLK